MKRRRTLALGCGGTLLVAVLALLWLGSSEPTRSQARQEAPGSPVTGAEHGTDNGARPAAAQGEESQRQAADLGSAQAGEERISPAKMRRTVAEVDQCMEDLTAACEADPLGPGIGVHTTRCKALVQVFESADYANMDVDEGWVEVGRAMFKTSLGLFRWNQQINACLKLQKQAKGKK